MIFYFIIEEPFKSCFTEKISHSRENYMPHYSPYDILLIANDRNPTFKEHVIILYYGKIFITTRSERIENGEKIIEYTGIRDKNFVVRENETDDVIGYVVDVYNETLKK